MNLLKSNFYKFSQLAQTPPHSAYIVGMKKGKCPTSFQMFPTHITIFALQGATVTDKLESAAPGSIEIVPTGEMFYVESLKKWKAKYHVMYDCPRPVVPSNYLERL